MLKRAQCQVAREHQQTMASVVLGCRGCHQTRVRLRLSGSTHRLANVVSGCQGTSQQPREELVTTVRWHRQPAGTIGQVCLRSKASTVPRPGVPRPAADKPRAPTAAMPPLCPGPPAPVSGGREGPGEPPGTSDGRSTFATLPTPASPWLPELRG